MHKHEALAGIVATALILASSSASAVHPPLTHGQAIQTRDNRDRRVVYSVVRSFVEKENCVLTPWGTSDKAGADNHDKVIVIAKQTAMIGATLYFLKYPGVFSQFDGGSAHRKLLDCFTYKHGATIPNCDVNDPEPVYNACRTANARLYLNDYFKSAQLMKGVGSVEDYDMALTGLINLLYVFQYDAVSVTKTTVRKILRPSNDPDCNDTPCVDYKGSGLRYRPVRVQLVPTRNRRADPEERRLVELGRGPEGGVHRLERNRWELP